METHEIREYADIEDLIGSEAAAELLAGELEGYAGGPAHSSTGPGLAWALRNRQDVYLEPFFEYGDIESMRRVCAEILSDRSASWLAEIGLPRESEETVSYGDLRFALPLALEERLAADPGWAMAAREVVDTVVRNVASLLENSPGVDVTVDELSLALDLEDEFGLGYWFDVDSIIDSMEFDMSLLLTGPGNSEGELLSSIIRWEDALRDSGAAPYERPLGARTTVLDLLCATQFTHIADVLNGTAPKTEFTESLSRELEESACAEALPAVCVMVRVSADAYIQACAAMDSRFLGLKSPEATFHLTVPAGASQPKIGIYDPVYGAAGLMGIHLDRDFEIPLPAVWLAMSEPDRGGTWGDDAREYYTPQCCCGFCDPFCGELACEPVRAVEQAPLADEPAPCAERADAGEER